MKPPVHVCATQRSAVVICTVPECGARDVGTSRSVVLAAMAHHYLVAHPEQARAADQLRRRAAATRGD